MSQQERLVFGRPETAEQALIRLPNRDNPLFDSDEVIEHLTILKEWYLKTPGLIAEGESSLEDRFIPLTIKDVAFMQHLSFSRGEILLTANQEYIPEDLFPWNELLPTGDNEYRWWQVSEISPKPLLPKGLNLVCIEMNSEFNLENDRYRFNDQSEFEMGFTSDEELEKLLEHLGQHGN